MARGDIYKELRAINEERAAENRRLRSALERCVQVLNECDGVGAPHPTLDAAIAGIAKVAGEGQSMQAIVYAWWRHLMEAGVCQSALQNRFTVGPTLYAVRNALAVGRSALGARPNEQPDTAGQRTDPGDDRQGGYAPAGTGC